MKTLTIKKFSESEDDFNYNTVYDDKQLYVVVGEEKVIYIGVSETSIFDRWFNQRTSHMFIPYNGCIVSRNSMVGLDIASNLPQSLSWEIDLWSIKELLDFLELEYTECDNGNYKFNDGFIYRLCKVKHLEDIMIKYLYPKHNVMGNNFGYSNEYFLNKYFSIRKLNNDNL